MGKFSVPAIVAIIVNCSSSQAGPLHEDFVALFELCRTAVEQSVPLNDMALQPTQVNAKHSRSWRNNRSEVGWKLAGSELYVVFTTMNSDDGTSRKLCSVYLKDPDRVLTEGEQGQLLWHFLLRQTELIGEGTHELDTQLSPIPPIMNLGFLLSEPNPRGCTVVSNISLLPDGTFFTAVIGEQSIRTCGPKN